MEILPFALVSLGIFYLIIALMSIFRFYSVIRSKSAIKISIAFYIGMFIASIVRGITLYLTSINLVPSIKDKTTEYNVFLYLMLIIPDMLNICVYLFLVWYFYANFIQSHINLANDLNIFLKDDIPAISNKTYKMLYFILPIYCIVFILTCLLTLLQILANDAFFKINSYFNMITPVLFIAYYIFLLVKFSGRPYINENLRQQVSRILRVVFVWSIARLVTGIIGIILSDTVINSIIDDFVTNKNDFKFSILVMIYFITSEYLPNFFALDYTFMMTYIKKIKERNDISNSEFEEEIKINSIGSPDTSRKISLDIKKKPVNIIKLTEFNLLELVHSKKNGFGSIYKAMLNNNEVICRVIKFDRLSRYDLEGLQRDLEEITVSNSQYICNILGVCVENIPNIYIFTPYFKLGSLYDILHVSKLQIDLRRRIEIAKNIAYGMNFLHENKIYHYHLSSKNIYVNDDYIPKIADYGFHNLKDIASVFLKYKNKNSYTSPELLRDNKHIGNIINNQDPKNDIYSFGILLWELYTSMIPFNVKINTLYDYVAIDNYRPEITKDFNQDIANLIRLCWDIDQLRRPNFLKIIELINKSKI